MKAVVFGPGRIGCGLAGEAFGAAGWELVFVARDRATVANLNRNGRYRVRLVDGRTAHERIVERVRAVPTSAAERVAAEVASADVVATAVGARNLPDVARALARGLAQRTAPVNVLAFENLASAGGDLQAGVNQGLCRGVRTRDGFSSVLVTRAVTHRMGDPARDELTFLGDPCEELVVSGPSLVGSLPKVPGLRVVDDLDAWFARKLYVFSAGHATTAYLGYLKGYTYIHAAIRDPEIRSAVIAAMIEGQRGLAQRYGAEVAGTTRDLDAIVKRFENAALDDLVSRVARDARRKLGASDRLVGAARLAEAAGVVPAQLALAATGALCFSDPTEPLGAVRDEIEARGLARTLADVSALGPGDPLARRVARVWRLLGREWTSDSPLVSLDELSRSPQRAPRIANEIAGLA
jgi:mannitol-1-phosphate 5-dehydrogenase